MKERHAHRRKLVKEFYRLGSYKRVAKLHGGKWTTVRRWVQRLDATGDVCDAPRSGRPSKGLNLPRAQQVLKRGTAKHLSCSGLAKDVKQKLGISVGTETVRLALKARGARSLRPIKVPRLTTKQKADRVRFAKKWKRLSWRNVVVSDSKIFYLHRKSKGEKVWVERDNDPPPREVVRGGFKVHVYAAVSKWGATPLFATAGTTKLKVIINDTPHKGGVDSQVYVDLLREKMIPACKKLMQPRYGNDWVFQQDGASAHTAKNTRSFMTKQKFRLMENWPACSPDLSWIENLWSWVERKLREQDDKLTEDNFLSTLQQVWNGIPSQLLKTLHGSIHSRLQECIDKQGKATRY